MEKRWKVARSQWDPDLHHDPVAGPRGARDLGTYSWLEGSPALTNQQALGWSLANAAFFYGSIILHELAHAATARCGVRASVPWTTLVFWGGYTETHAGERGPLATFPISASGPLTTLALAGVFWEARRPRTAPCPRSSATSCY